MRSDFLAITLTKCLHLSATVTPDLLLKSQHQHHPAVNDAVFNTASICIRVKGHRIS